MHPRAYASLRARGVRAGVHFSRNAGNQKMAENCQKLNSSLKMHGSSQAGNLAAAHASYRYISCRFIGSSFEPPLPVPGFLPLAGDCLGEAGRPWVTPWREGMERNIQRVSVRARLALASVAVGTEAVA